MNMSKEKVLEVCIQHRRLFTDLSRADWTADEIFAMLNFASDFLHHEACATEEKEPYATNYIMRLKDVAYDAYSLGDEVYDVLHEEGEDN